MRPWRSVVLLKSSWWMSICKVLCSIVGHHYCSESLPCACPACPWPCRAHCVLIQSLLCCLSLSAGSVWSLWRVLKSPCWCWEVEGTQSATLHDAGGYHFTRSSAFHSLAVNHFAQIYFYRTCVCIDFSSCPFLSLITASLSTFILFVIHFYFTWQI